jgi:hypothetical protein
VDNIVFDSKKEAGRYIELKLMQQAGQITDLHLQQVFNLDVNGITVGHYIADFTYRHKEWPGLIVEDVKSPATRTALYQLKKKIFQAQYGITITET